MKFLSLSLFLSLGLTLFPFLLGFVAHADEFGQGDLKFHISFVPIASNEPSVDFKGESMPFTDYDYRISKTEISIAQFLQARISDARISRPVVNFWNSQGYYYNTDNIPVALEASGVHAPATNINLIECFKFCNWLTSGDPYQGAYKILQNANPEEDSLDVYDYVDRESALAEYGTVYVVPTYYEWNKAAFFKPDGSGFSFYSNGTGSGNVYYINSGNSSFTDAYNNALDYFTNTYGDLVNVMFVDIDWDNSYYRYFDADGVEQTIIPKTGFGGWNSSFQEYPWQVGSSAREQNGTYDMYGNVGEYLEEILDYRDGFDFKVTASCWNGSDSLGRYLGGNTIDSLDMIEAFSTVNRSSDLTFKLEDKKSGDSRIGLRVVALGAVPEARPLPEVQSTITEGGAHLNWDSTVGRIYQLQYSNSIEDGEAEWIDIGQEIHGSGGTEFFVVSVDNEEERNRFYRVVDFD